MVLSGIDLTSIQTTIVALALRNVPAELHSKFYTALSSKLRGGQRPMLNDRVRRAARAAAIEAVEP
jgi:hypothetical protein